MVLLRSSLLAATFLLVGALVGYAQTSSKFKEIGLERTMCYGTCPAYKVRLLSDGTLYYEGIAHVARKGKYQATIYSQDFEKLGKLVDRFGLFKLKNSYAAQVTDQPSAITTIKMSGKNKVINDYGLVGPIDLWAFNAAIDGIVQNARDWRKR